MKLNREDIENIYTKKRNGVSVHEISNEYHVNANTIYRAIEKYELSQNSKISEYSRNLEKEKIKTKILNLAARYNIGIKFQETEECNENTHCEKCNSIIDS